MVLLAAALSSQRGVGEDSELVGGPPAALRADSAPSLAAFDRARAQLMSAVLSFLHVGWCSGADPWDKVTGGRGRPSVLGVDTKQRFGGLQTVPTLGLVAKLVRTARQGLSSAYDNWIETQQSAATLVPQGGARARVGG